MPVLLGWIQQTTLIPMVFLTKITNQQLLILASLPVLPCKTLSCAKLFIKVLTPALVKTFKKNRESSLGLIPTSYWERGSTGSRLVSPPLLVLALQLVLKRKHYTW